MDFTESYHHSASLVQFSPGAQFLLAALYDTLTVYRSDTLCISRSWSIDLSPSPTQTFLQASSSKPSPSDASITHIGWSCDSEYILVACAKRGSVHVYKLRDEQWSRRIDAGAEGLVKAEWAPDGRSILCFSEWGIRVTIWSLITKSAVYIQFPIHPDRGYAFRADGRYFVMAERHKSKDTVGVYDATTSYKLTRHFPLPTSSLASLTLSPTGNYLAVWEGLLEFRVHIVTLTGDKLGSFSPESDPGLGIRHVTWHPSGTFLAVGGCNDKHISPQAQIYILDSSTWSPAVTLDISSRVPASTIVWREPLNWLEATFGRGFISYERLQGPLTVPMIRSEQARTSQKSGVAQIEWNTTGSLLLARVESMPNVIYLYDFPSPQERFSPRLRTVLIHSQPVLQARWNPVRRNSLVLCCGGQSVYGWSDEWVGENGIEEEMAECIGVPTENFNTREVRWAPDGKGFVLLDKDQFCCGFEVLSG